MRTELHDQIQQAARRALAEHASHQKRSLLLDQNKTYNPALWNIIANDLGWFGLAIPEDDGGSGLGSEEIALILEECGKNLICAPVFESLAAIAIITRYATLAQRRNFLPTLATGEKRASFALSITADDQTTLPAKLTSPNHITGTAHHVPQADLADFIVTATHSPTPQNPNRTQFAIVETTAPGVTITTQDGFDPTRRLCHLTLTNTPATILGDPAADVRVVQNIRPTLETYLAAEQIGIASAMLDLTTEYVKTRTQFNRPIGSFQAIKHTLADMTLNLEAARSALMLAIESPDDALSSAIALSTASDTALLCTSEAIQLHGGIGFTWEYPAHFYFKRARLNSLLLGTPEWLREQIAKSLFPELENNP